MLSPNLPQKVLRVKFMKSIELNTKFAVSLALESIIYKKNQNKENKSNLGHLEFLKIVKILKNILSDLC